MSSRRCMLSTSISSGWVASTRRRSLGERPPNTTTVQAGGVGLRALLGRHAVGIEHHGVHLLGFGHLQAEGKVIGSNFEADARRRRAWQRRASRTVAAFLRHEQHFVRAARGSGRRLRPICRTSSGRAGRAGGRRAGTGRPRAGRGAGAGNVGRRLRRASRVSKVMGRSLLNQS